MAIPSISTSDRNTHYNWDTILTSSVQYDGEYGSGMTLIYSKKMFSYCISCRGKDTGGLGLTNTNRDAILTKGTYAIGIVGGDNMGLESLCAVNKRLLEESRKRKDIKFMNHAIGACCFTYNLVKHPDDFIYPDLVLGNFCFDKLKSGTVPIGRIGCGLNSKIGKIPYDWLDACVDGGMGSCFFEDSSVKILTIINLNSVGVVHEHGKLLHKYAIKHEGFDDIKTLSDLPEYAKRKEWLDKRPELQPLYNPKNTTLSIMVTNIILDAKRRYDICETFHDVVESMIYPYGTTYDGDVFFLASTNEIDCTEQNLKILMENGKNNIIQSIKSVFL